MSETPNLKFTSETPADGLRKVLNSHGYGFQYASLKRCLLAESLFPWKLAETQYPVTLNGTEISIDFILGSRTHLLVVECKRTIRWVWGFARSGRLPQLRPRPCADYLEWQEGPPRLVRRAKWFGNPNPPYDVSVQFTVEGKGNASKNAGFDLALAQVMRARGGLIEEIGTAEGLRYGGGAVIPAIFTTARLMTTETECQ